MERQKLPAGLLGEVGLTMKCHPCLLRFLFFLVICLRQTPRQIAGLLAILPFAMPLVAQTSDYPVFVAQIPNPNDYVLFANSGWDGNWYVGYNNGWVKKLPAVPNGNYARAYLGAKLGRMKTLP